MLPVTNGREWNRSARLEALVGEAADVAASVRAVVHEGVLPGREGSLGDPVADNVRICVEPAQLPCPNDHRPVQCDDLRARGRDDHRNVVTDLRVVVARDGEHLELQRAGRAEIALDVRDSLIDRRSPGKGRGARGDAGSGCERARVADQRRRTGPHVGSFSDHLVQFGAQ
jgi:hypothetical protein